MFFILCVYFRCVPVCSAHMLSGSALYVHVHGDGNLPIHTEEAQAKRLVITPRVTLLFQHPVSIVFCNPLPLKLDLKSL